MFAFIIPHCPLSVKQKAKKLYQGSLAAPSGGGAPRSPRCPLWGKCRAAAKGVTPVTLSCYHSSNNTPSVSLAGSEVPSSLPAPPSGSQRPRCPLWGWCSAQRIKIVMIAGGNHTSVSCREAAKGVSLVILSCYHSSNNTPSVSLAGSEVPSSLPAPPPGSRGCTPSSSILFTKCFLTLRGSFAIIRDDFGRGRR